MLQRFHFIHWHRRIDLRDFPAQRAEHARGIECGADVERGASGKIGLEERDEYLAVRALPRPLVERVLGNPDDLHRPFATGLVAKTDVPADGALVAEEMAGELLVHD